MKNPMEKVDFCDRKRSEPSEKTVYIIPQVQVPNTYRILLKNSMATSNIV